MAEKKFSDLIPVRNPATQKSHDRETLWQITVPLIVGMLVIIAVAALPVVAVSRGGDVSVWGDISLIWLIVPTMFFCLIPLILFAALTYGVTALLGKTPVWMFQLQGFFTKGQGYVRYYGDKAAGQVIKVRANVAKAKTLVGRSEQNSTNSNTRV